MGAWTGSLIAGACKHCGGENISCSVLLPAPPTGSWWSVHQGEICHFIVNIVKVVRLLRTSPVHVSGKFAALGRGHTHWRSVWARAVA